MKRSILALMWLGLLSRSGWSGEIPCSPVSGGAVQLDGLLMDWKEAKGVGADDASQIVRGARDWTGAGDLSFDVYCAHDKRFLYLAVNVRDDYFIRTAKAAGDDHIVVLLGGKRLVVHPGDLRRDVKGRLRWGRRGRVRKIGMAEAMQKQGYSVELRIPFKQIPGYRRGAPSFRGAVWVADSDSRAKMKIQTVMGTARSARTGRFVFAQAQAELSGFLRDRGYSPSQVRMKKNVNVVGTRQVEQVVLVGRTIGIVGNELPGGAYFFIDLPVKQHSDVYWLRPMDLNGDGKAELVTRYVERAGNGRRELVVVFRFNDADKFVRSFAHEILKGQGRRMITNRFGTRRRRRRGRKRGGIDLIFDRPRAKGFSRTDYREVPCQDCFAILLPWGEEKKRRFVFEGEEFSQK
jgi:hypothetical protein